VFGATACRVTDEGALPPDVQDPSTLRTPAGALARYREAVAALVTHLVRQGAAVTFVSTCQGVPEYVNDDSAVAAEIAAKLPPDVASSVEVDRDWHAPEELRAKLRGFDLAISTRMHLAILALGQGVPVFSIAYEFKADELFSQLSLGPSVLPIEDADPATIVARFDAFLGALPPDLFARVEVLRESALAAMQRTASLLE
jgi:colanic acid/amylovoran biosynthesis protein